MSQARGASVPASPAVEGEDAPRDRRRIGVVAKQDFGRRGDVFEPDLPIFMDQVIRRARHVAPSLVGEVGEGGALGLGFDDAAHAPVDEERVIGGGRTRSGTLAPPRLARRRHSSLSGGSARSSRRPPINRRAGDVLGVEGRVGHEKDQPMLNERASFARCLVAKQGPLKRCKLLAPLVGL